MVFAGLLMEILWEKHWYKNLSVFRRSKRIREIGAWVVTAGVLIELVVAVKFAIIDWESEPMNQPINDLSAEARFLIKGDRHTHLSSETGDWSAWLTLCIGNNISNKVFFLSAESSDVTVANILGGDTDRECDIKFRKPVSTLTFPEYPGWGMPAKNFNKVTALVLQIRTSDTNMAFTVLRGEVDAVVNGQMKWKFDIPQQNERLGCITSQRTTIKSTAHWSVLPVDLIDMTGKPAGRYDGK